MLCSWRDCNRIDDKLTCSVVPEAMHSNIKAEFTWFRIFYLLAQVQNSPCILDFFPLIADRCLSKWWSKPRNQRCRKKLGFLFKTHGASPKAKSGSEFWRDWQKPSRKSRTDRSDVATGPLMFIDFTVYSRSIAATLYVLFVLRLGGFCAPLSDNVQNNVGFPYGDTLNYFCCTWGLLQTNIL